MATSALPGLDSVDKTARLSDCGRYRYRLTRTWDRGLPPLGFVMLNPSTADADQDDPTIRRCVGFAKRDGFGGIDVANLYAWRATKPADLLDALDPFGHPTNVDALEDLFRFHPVVIAAWGPKYGETLKRRRHRAHVIGKSDWNPDGRIEVRAMANRHGSALLCLGTTQDGSPRHPSSA